MTPNFPRGLNDGHISDMSWYLW